MVSGPKAQLIIQFDDPVLDEEDCNRGYLRLLAELKSNPDIDAIYRVPITTPPEMSKSGLSFVKNLLTAEITCKSIEPVFKSLYGRLTQKTIELEVEANGQRMKVTAGNRGDLDAAIQHAQTFISQAATQTPILEETAK